MDFDSFLSNNLSFILDIAPHGIFLGCGETSEFINYILKNKPNGEKDIFEVLRNQLYYDTAVNKKEFTINQFNDILAEIDERLNQFNYVTISFYNYEEITNDSINNKEIVNSIKDLIFNSNNVKCKLFDHSFILAKLDDNYIRLESYIFNYKPRQIIWNTYQQDVKELLSSQDKLKIWKQLFDVECDQHFSKDKVRIVINN